MSNLISPEHIYSTGGNRYSTESRSQQDNIQLTTTETLGDDIENHVVYNGYQKRNYMTTSFTTSHGYKPQNAQAVFQIPLNGQNNNYQQQFVPCIVPMYMPGQDDNELIEECESLKARVKQLESRAPEIKIVTETIQDDSKLSQLEFENQKLRIQLTAEQDKTKLRDGEFFELRQKFNSLELTHNNEVNTLQKQLKDYENKIFILTTEVTRLNGLLRLNEDEINELNFRFEELQNSSMTMTEEKVTYLTNEIEVWKQRFIKLNREFHTNQEALLMAEAELDSIRKSGQTVREVTVEQVQRSGVRTTVKGEETNSQIISQLTGNKIFP